MFAMQTCCGVDGFLGCFADVGFLVVKLADAGYLTQHYSRPEADVCVLIVEPVSGAGQFLLCSWTFPRPGAQEAVQGRTP